jgi:hypothetical protein
MTPCPTEHWEQVALMQWAAVRARQCPALNLLFAIPNGGDRHPVVAAKLKAEGVKKGVPDLCLPVARHGCHGLYVEMKRVRGGAVSAEQDWWHAQLDAEGYRVVVCRGWLAARDALCDYLTIQP